MKLNHEIKAKLRKILGNNWKTNFDRTRPNEICESCGLEIRYGYHPIRLSNLEEKLFFCSPCHLKRWVIEEIPDSEEEIASEIRAEFIHTTARPNERNLWRGVKGDGIKTLKLYE